MRAGERATEKTPAETRNEIFGLVEEYYDHETAAACDALIEALVSWSHRAGLQHIRHEGESHVLKYGLSSGGAEVWAIYSEKRSGKGPKLSLVPGLQECGQELREYAQSILPREADLNRDGKTLLTLAWLVRQAPLFEILRGLRLAVKRVRAG